MPTWQTSNDGTRFPVFSGTELNDEARYVMAKHPETYHLTSGQVKALLTPPVNADVAAAVDYSESHPPFSAHETPANLVQGRVEPSLMPHPHKEFPIDDPRSGWYPQYVASKSGGNPMAGMSMGRAAVNVPVQETPVGRMVPESAKPVLKRIGVVASKVDMVVHPRSVPEDQWHYIHGGLWFLLLVFIGVCLIWKGRRNGQVSNTSDAMPVHRRRFLD